MEKTRYFHWEETPGSPFLFVSCKYRESEEEINRETKFAYWRASRDFPAHRIYLRDPHRSHYHHGIPGLADDLHDLCDRLMWFIWSREIRKVVLLGASQGGYLALVLGKLIELRDPRLHLRSFSYDPQTKLRYQPGVGSILVDGSEPKYRWGYIRGPSPTPELMDLKDLFAAHPPRKGRHRFYVHYGTEEEDIHYAENLRRATEWPTYCELNWRRRLIIRQVRRRRSVHGSEIVRQNQTGRLQARLQREFTGMLSH